MTTRQLVEAVKTTIADGGSIRPQGGGTKAHFLTMPDDSVVVSTQAHTGIVHYHADELVVRVKAGTLLSELTEILAAKGQYLPAEPPAYGNAATIGGAVAAGLSGHGRPYAGGLRDFDADLIASFLQCRSHHNPGAPCPAAGAMAPRNAGPSPSPWWSWRRTIRRCASAAPAASTRI